MGSYLSKPKLDKQSEDFENNKRYECGYSGMQGWRSAMEDAHNCIPNVDDNTGFFAVYDGHGGSEVAMYCAINFLESLKNTPEFQEKKYNEALSKTFLKLDAELLEADTLRILKILSQREPTDGLPSIEDLKTLQEPQEEEDEDEARLLEEEAQMNIEDVLKRYQSSLQKNSPSAAAMISSSMSNKDDPPTNSSEKESPSKISNKSSPSKSYAKVESTPSENVASNEVKKEEIKVEETAKPSEESCDKSIYIYAKKEETEETPATKQEDCDKSSREFAKYLKIKTIRDMLNSTDGTVKSPKKEETEESFQTATKQEDCDKSSRDAAKLLKIKTIRDMLNKSSTDGTVKSPKKSDNTEPSVTDEAVKTEAPSSPTKKLVKVKPPKRNKSFPNIDDDSEDEDFHIANDSDDSDMEEEEDDSEDDDDDECLDDDEDDSDEDDDVRKADMPNLFEYLRGGGNGNFIEIPGQDSGTTAVVALLRENKLIVANAGDSRCVVSRTDGIAFDMSDDHKPEDEIELKRIKNAGGEVNDQGRVNGGLNLSRAIGDHTYKRNKDLPLEKQMISALPDLRVIDLVPGDEFMVLACDGIWNVMSSQEVVDFVRDELNSSSPQDGANGTSNKTKLSKICEKMFDHCLAADTMGDGTGCDNMTCVIVKFDQEWLKTFAQTPQNGGSEKTTTNGTKSSDGLHADDGSSVTVCLKEDGDAVQQKTQTAKKRPSVDTRDEGESASKMSKSE